MNRKNDVGSVYGRPDRICYEYIKNMKKYFEEEYNVLILDDKDGLHSIPFASKGAKVVMYEPNEIFINGGIIDGVKISNISNRKNWEKVSKNIEIRNSNFYEEKVEDKYNFVFCYRSLHEKHNKEVPMRRKMRKLLSSVKEGGYVYILYHMAKNEDDISNFSRHQYVREGEMMLYFSPKNWEIIFIKENKKLTNHNSHPFHKKNHTHRVGHVFAKKKNNRLVHNYTYNIIPVYKEKENNHITYFS